jgi:hypothetical protein
MCNRYTITYSPAADRILPSPSHLHVRIKNSSAIALRAAYLHGPYTLHVAAYPSTFDPNDKTKNRRKDGVPQFEPNVKAGGSFNAKIPIPEENRVTGHSLSSGVSSSTPKSVTWIIEIASQILFSSSASVHFEVLISRDEKSLEYNFAAVGTHGHGEPGKVQDHQHRRRQSHSGQPKGVYSKAITMVVDDTESLWNKPALPEAGRNHTQRRVRVSGEFLGRGSTDKERTAPKKKQKIHLVILTHGLHSNLSADLLYLKESIDATAKQARESARARRKAARSGKSSDTKQDKASTAPLSGGQEDLDEDSEDDDEEQIIVRGFSGNAVKTESGIQYLGKRLAKWVLDMTYPDQPYKPLRKSMSKKLSDALSTKSNDGEDGKPTHSGSTIRLEDPKPNDLAYTFTSISFVGHSLGGLIQLYAIGYIQKHAPKFFDQIKPVNFICMASPLLGLSNENPMYVKFALDFGLVGRTGQDLGLTWRPPTLAKSGWTAMMGGLGAHKDEQQEDPGAKPLLRILPTGPAHRVLRLFRNRTVYSNVVNDGIVPLRTSCLLFLDWRGLGKVEKAQRENGLIGTMAGWGWAEITGGSSSPNPSRVGLIESNDDSQDDSDSPEASVPQPSDDATNDDGVAPVISPVDEHQFMQLHHPPESSKAAATNPGLLDGLLSFIRPSAKTTKKDIKMFRRSQTILSENGSPAPSSHASQTDGVGEMPPQSQKRPPATRGDSILDDPSNALAPPKTTIFESAGDILNPPIPPTSWIVDPTSRTRTIFHDRVYHPEDIPPPPTKRPSRHGRSVSGSETPQIALHVGFAEASTASVDQSNMRVEEKIARAYHKDLSWRKVLVRLEPDAHNNMIVRRMFANAYGWPVIKHLCDTHFGDTYAATTRDEEEPATDRAKGIENPVGATGEHVKGQEDVEPPKRPASEMREAADELSPLRSSSGDGESRPVTSATNISTMSDSWDEVYFNDTTDDEAGEPKGPIQRFFSPPPGYGKGGATTSASKNPSSLTTLSPPSAQSPERKGSGTSHAEIADFLTATPPALERGDPLAPATKSDDIKAVRSATEIGLGRKSLEDMVGGSSPSSPKKAHSDSAAPAASVTEQIARIASKGEDQGG